MSLPLELRLMYEGTYSNPYLCAQDVHMGQVRSGWLSSILDDYLLHTQKATKFNLQEVQSTTCLHLRQEPKTNVELKADEEQNSDVSIQNSNAKEQNVLVQKKSTSRAEATVQTDTEISIEKVKDSVLIAKEDNIGMENKRNELFSEEYAQHEQSEEHLTSTNDNKEAKAQELCEQETRYYQSQKDKEEQLEEKEGEEEHHICNIVDKLYDKIRLNAVKVVALDDLNQQLIEHLANVGGNKHLETKTATLKSTTTLSTSPSQWPIINGLELSECLYSLRTKVQQLREQVVAREERLAERERQLELQVVRAERKTKSTRHLKVEVIRAYEEEPQPHVKPPYKPVLWPQENTKHRKHHIHISSHNSISSINNSSGSSSTIKSSGIPSYSDHSRLSSKTDTSFPTYNTQTSSKSSLSSSSSSSIITTEKASFLTAYTSSTHKSVSRQSNKTSTSSVASSSSSSFASEEESSSSFSSSLSENSKYSNDSALELYKQRRRLAIQKAANNKKSELSNVNDADVAHSRKSSSWSSENSLLSSTTLT